MLEEWKGDIVARKYTVPILKKFRTFGYVVVIADEQEEEAYKALALKKGLSPTLHVIGDGTYKRTSLFNSRSLASSICVDVNNIAQGKRHGSPQRISIDIKDLSA